MEKIFVGGCEAKGGILQDNGENVATLGFLACTGIKTRREIGFLSEQDKIVVSEICSKYFSCRQSVFMARFRGEIRGNKCPLLDKK